MYVTPSKLLCKILIRASQRLVCTEKIKENLEHLYYFSSYQFYFGPRPSCMVILETRGGAFQLNRVCELLEGRGCEMEERGLLQ